MKKIILVPMTRNDRAADLLPYVEEVARPGMKAVFMMPYPVDGFRWSREESGCKAIEEGMRLARDYNWNTNVERARKRIAATTAALSAMGIEAGVELYAGNMGRAIREYAAKGDVHLIVSRAGIGQKIAGLLSGNSSLFDLFKRASFEPVLLIHPTTVG
jgi:hypothetical protein